MDYLLDQNSKNQDHGSKSPNGNSNKFCASKKNPNSSISIHPSDISFDGGNGGAGTRKGLDDSCRGGGGGIGLGVGNSEIELSVKVIFGRQTRKRQVPWAGRLGQFDAELATVGKLFFWPFFKNAKMNTVLLILGFSKGRRLTLRRPRKKTRKRPGRKGISSRSRAARQFRPNSRKGCRR